MIYLVDITCYSSDAVSRIAGRLDAKSINYDTWWSMISNPAFTTAYSNAIWVLAWDDSPFSGDLFENAMEAHLIPMERSFFIELNDPGTLLMWKSRLRADINRKFGPWHDHVYITDGRDTNMARLCDTVLHLERELSCPPEFFKPFPALWAAFEDQLKHRIVEDLSKKAASGTAKLSAIYRDTGLNYWRSGTGRGYRWKAQLNEVFFENRYYNTFMLLDRFTDLDDLAAQGMEGLGAVDAQEQYCLAVKPLLDERKQQLMAAFAEMEEELSKPLPYVLKVPVDGQETPLTLGFQKRYKKRETWGSMDGYLYSFNGSTYKGIQQLRMPIIGDLSGNVGILRDAYGRMALRRYTEIPTFDSSDREWDSEEIEYLMFDGKDIHLVIMRGGYHIAHLIFFEKLLTADSRMKPIFEKLNWPMDRMIWT